MQPPKEVTKNNPCPHCGKPDWCYSLELEADNTILTVCNRDALPADGWIKTSKSDKNGKSYYALASSGQKKAYERNERFEWIYYDRKGIPLVRVVRENYTSPRAVYDGKYVTRRIWQEKFVGGKWIPSVKDVNRVDIPIYRYAEVKQAIERGQRIYVVEGEPCADALWKLGIPATTNIGGSGKWQDSDSNDLAGASVVLCPDRDKPGIKHMKTIELQLEVLCDNIQWLYAFPDSPMWNRLSESGGLDVADWIAEQKLNKESVESRIGDRKPEHDKLEDDILKAIEPPPVQAKQSKTMFLIETIEQGWGKRLKFNLMINKPELDGEILNLDSIFIHIAREFDIDVPTDKAIAIVMELAKRNSYSPVCEYLHRVEIQHGSDTSILDNMADRYLKTNNPIYNVFLRKTMIAAVARQFEPGCKVDTACILKGGQGIGKSSFWRKLCGAEWFDDSLNDANDKDQKLKLTRFWILEFGEFECVHKKKDMSSLKAFMSTPVDSIRPPYGRSIEDFPRTSILVGSTNRDDFLLDPTGSRRFWVIDLEHDIDLAALERDRDKLWAAAVAAYRAGESWNLTKEELLESERLNEDYMPEDVWTKPISEYVEGLSQTTTAAVMEVALKMDLWQQDRMSQMRVAEIMKLLGWVQVRRREDGDRVRVWIRKPEVTLPSPTDPSSDCPDPTCPNLNSQLSPKSEAVGVAVENSRKVSNMVGTGQDKLIVQEYEISMEQALQAYNTPSQPINEESNRESEQDDPFCTEENLLDIADQLGNEDACDSKEALSRLRVTWTSKAMNKACKRLTPERHAVIMQWVLELNAESKRNESD